jgi:hypothetical protein
MRSKITIQADIKSKRERLQAYYDRELQVLSKDGVKSYGIGSRNLSRFDTSLADIRAMIKQLEGEITALENELAGNRPRRAMAAVPHGEW